MLGRVLGESSIHGLRYLSEARHPLVKLAWLAVVTASVTAAALIIRANVSDWLESPAVVTSVGSALAKDHTPLPMVAVCPRHANLHATLFRLLTDPDLSPIRDPERKEKFVHDLDVLMVKAQVKFLMHN